MFFLFFNENFKSIFRRENLILYWIEVINLFIYIFVDEVLRISFLFGILLGIVYENLKIEVVCCNLWRMLK